jgi:hypothetical protein
MKFKNSINQDDVLKNSSESKRVDFLVYILKRISYYLTLLYGILTILFLLSFFFPLANKFENTILFLYFSLIMFIIYGIITFSAHLLQKSYLMALTDESAKPTEPATISSELANRLLQGKTLQVYWYIFTHNHAGIREIQKALKFTSSGTVSYQVSKLLNAGIITKDESEGKYAVKKEFKIGIFKFFIRIGNRMVPRISLYLIIYLLGLTVFLFLAFLSGYSFIWNPLNLFLLLLLFVGIIIFCIESYRIWKLNPTR